MSEPQGGYNAPIQFEVTTPEERRKKPPARGMTVDEVQRFLDQPIQGVGSFRGVRDATEEEMTGVSG
jgi:hypothetical protein